MTMRSTGHIRQRTPGSWELRYSLGRDPATGKRRVATTTVEGKCRDAEKELRRLLRTLDTGEHVDPTRLSVGQWLEQWLETVKTEVAPKTHERYGEIARNFLIPALGNYALTKLVPPHIQKAYNGWATGGRIDGKTGGLAPQTRRHIHRILRTALARAVEQQVIARNPADVFRKRLPKVERRDLVTLTADQSAQLLEAIGHSRVYWPVLLALLTGMRRGEILALRWKNVDLELGILRVVESLEQTKTGIRFKTPKSGRHRAVTLPAYAVQELRRLKCEQAESLLALGVRQTGDTLLCCRSDGEPHQPLSLTYEFARFMGRLKGLLRVRFHDLRHSHATQLLASGVHPKIASERLGHASVGITLDLYSHVTDTMQSEAAAKLDLEMQAAKSRLAVHKRDVR
jgi:integrase